MNCIKYIYYKLDRPIVPPNLEWKVLHFRESLVALVAQFCVALSGDEEFVGHADDI